jgi:type VII secretion integral membrane protein EccD
MATGVLAGYTRVTIAAPECRVDLALPHVATVGEVLPQLLRLTGVASNGKPNGGWLLSRLGERPLDTGRSVLDLGLHDGELLYLNPRRAQPPAPVFDDVVDAIGGTAAARPGRWREAHTRRTGLAVGAGLLVASAAIAALAGGVRAVAVAAGLAVLLLALAGGLARAAGTHRPGAVLAGVAVAFAAAAGFAAVPPAGGLGHAGAVQLVLAAAGAVTAAALGSVAVGAHGPWFAGLAVAAGLGGLAGVGALVWHASAAQAAAVTAVAIVVATPFTPTLSLRLAGVSLPTVPGDPGELRRASATDPDPALPDRTRAADRYLGALLAGGAAALVGAAALLAASGGWAARLLCLALALALPLRSRAHPVLFHRLVLIVAGAAIGVLLLASVTTVVLSAGLLAAAGLVAVVAGLVVPGRRTSPYWGRLLDWLEIACLVAVIPLAVAVLGLYAYAHGLGG